MTQEAIFGPVLTTILLTFVVWVVMFARRIPFITSQELGDEELSKPGALAALSPPEVNAPSDNLKNLFELPVLFYALALMLYASDRVDTAYVVAAWIFAAFRVLHSFEHCTKNVIMRRFYLYLVSCVALWFIAGRAMVQYALG